MYDGRVYFGRVYCCRVFYTEGYITAGDKSAGYTMAEYMKTGYTLAGYITAGSITKEAYYWLPRPILVNASPLRLFLHVYVYVYVYVYASNAAGQTRVHRSARRQVVRGCRLYGLLSSPTTVNENRRFSFLPPLP